MCGQEEEDSPQLLRTRSDASFMRVQRRSKTHTARDLQRLRTHRFSINGHFYNHKVNTTRIQGHTLMYPVVDTSPGAEGQWFPMWVCLNLCEFHNSLLLISLMCHRIQGYTEFLHQFLLNIPRCVCVCCYWTDSSCRLSNFLSFRDFLLKMSRVFKSRSSCSNPEVSRSFEHFVSSHL